MTDNELIAKVDEHLKSGGRRPLTEEEKENPIGEFGDYSSDELYEFNEFPNLWQDVLTEAKIWAKGDRKLSRRDKIIQYLRHNYTNYWECVENAGDKLPFHTKRIDHLIERKIYEKYSIFLP